jgi:hypothetical protein
LRPLFLNAVHRSISQYTISNLQSFSDQDLASKITTVIAGVVTPLAPLSISVTIDAFTSVYENKTASVEIATLTRRNNNLQSIYNSLLSVGSSSDFTYQVMQAI